MSHRFDLYTSVYNKELEQQVSAHPRLWIRRGRDRGFISFEYKGMRLNVRLIILELLEQGRDCGFISFEYEGMRLNVCLINLELLKQYWAGCKHRLLIARYLHHHYEGARVAPMRRICDHLQCFNLNAGLGCVEGWGGNEGARVTCGCFMAGNRYTCRENSQRHLSL